MNKCVMVFKFVSIGFDTGAAHFSHVYATLFSSSLRCRYA